MTVRVSLDQLPQTAALYGDTAYVITSAGSVSPRVTHVEVEFSNDNGSPILRTHLGKMACRELRGNRNVTILWAVDPSAVGTEEFSMSLIVDGHVQDVPGGDGGGEIAIICTSAIKHASRTTRS
jgi:hypothetical protein